MILHEIHEKDCTCSYCKSSRTYKKLHYGLNIPKNWKAWNSWYVIKYWDRRYIRWTHSFLRK